MLALFAMAFLIPGMITARVSMTGRRQPFDPQPDGTGWLKVSEEGSIARKLRLYLLLSLGWFGCYAIVAGDYLVLNGGQIGGASVILLILPVGIGLIPLMLARRYWKLRHDLLDTELSVRRVEFRAGDPLPVRVRQQTLRALSIDELAVGLVCIRSDRTQSGGKTTYSSREESARWQTVVSGRACGAGEEISAVATLSIDANAPPTGSPGISGYPYFRWHLAARVKVRGEPTLNAKYPILVLPAIHSAVIESNLQP